ncbi:MAG: sigma-70 family RNA polymerase sigma factor [Cytobacillus gottheilii]|uniref:RNA polymerase sigma factor n=1 Tax=Cytobacillus gottheilii TaxID=859144 RepID=UPI0008303F4A|nr:sigma-70 family RNA polymerase sigma factor [Cytobacillus gottheilii]
MDEDYFNELYERYFHRLYHVAYRITKDQQLAEDAVHETYIKAIKKIQCVEDSKKIGAWLSVIAARTAIDIIRKEKKSNVMSMEHIHLKASSLQTDHNVVEKDVEASLFNQNLYKAIHQLSAHYQTILLLKLQKGLKEQEIADILHINQNTVKTRLYRARQKLKILVNRLETA